MLIDILTYAGDSFSTQGIETIDMHDPYRTALRDAYGAGLAKLIDKLPPRRPDPTGQS